MTNCTVVLIETAELLLQQPFVLQAWYKVRYGSLPRADRRLLKQAAIAVYKATAPKAKVTPSRIFFRLDKFMKSLREWEDSHAGTEDEKILGYYRYRINDVALGR